MSEVRTLGSVVSGFKKRMEAILKRNEHKTGWDKLTVHDLLRRLRDETTELQRAIDTALETDDEVEVVIDEAADVANYAAFLLAAESDRAFWRRLHWSGER